MLETQRFSPEIEKQPERRYEFVDTNAIIISGPPGSGTTSVAEALCRKLNLTEDSIIKIGERRRLSDHELHGRQTEDVLPADKEIELTTDAFTKHLLQTKTAENPVIIEAQLGGFIGKWTENEADRKKIHLPRNLRVLIDADETFRAERVKQRWEARGGQKYSVEEWIERNRARQKKDQISWKKTYRKLRGRNPHDRNVKDGDENVYHAFYDSTGIHYEDIADHILFFMQIEGNLRRVRSKGDQSH